MKILWILTNCFRIPLLVLYQDLSYKRAADWTMLVLTLQPSVMSWNRWVSQQRCGKPKLFGMLYVPFNTSYTRFNTYPFHFINAILGKFIFVEMCLSQIPSWLPWFLMAITKALVGTSIMYNSPQRIASTVILIKLMILLSAVQTSRDRIKET